MANENFKLDVTGSDINAVVDLLSDWIDTGYFKINDSMKLNILSNLDDSNLRTDKLTVGKGTIDSVDYLIVAYNNTQIAFRNGGSDVKIRYYSSTWSSWKDIITDDNIDTKIDTLGYLKPVENSTLNSLGILDLIYPIGSIYMSFENIDPGTLFGGTWEYLGGKFLLGAASANTELGSGGEAEHTLTVNEMPSHNHGGTVTTSENGAHTHDVRGGASTSGSQSLLESKPSIYSTTRDISGAALSNGAHTHTVTIDSVGSGQAFSIMPPYQTVYMWQRVDSQNIGG